MVLRLSLLLLSLIACGRCQEQGGVEVLFVSSRGKAVLASHSSLSLAQGQIVAPEDRILLSENAQIRLLFIEPKSIRKYRAPASIDLQSEITRFHREQAAARSEGKIIKAAYSWLAFFKLSSTEANTSTQGRHAASTTATPLVLKTYLTNPRLFLHGDGHPHQLSVVDPISGAIMAVLDVSASTDLIRLHIPEKQLQHGKIYPLTVDQSESSIRLQVITRSEATRVTSALKQLSDDAIDAREFDELAAAYLHEQGFILEAFQYAEKGLAINPQDRRLQNLYTSLLAMLPATALPLTRLGESPGHSQPIAQKRLYFPVAIASDSVLRSLSGAMHTVISHELRGSSRITVLEKEFRDTSLTVIRRDGVSDEQEMLRLADAAGADYLLLGDHQGLESGIWIVRYSLLQVPSGAVAGQWIGDKVALADAAALSSHISRKISACIDHELFLGALDRLKPNRDDFSLLLRSDKSECRIGEAFSLTFSTSRPGYLWIYTMGTSGKSRLLFPPNQEGGYHLAGGESFTLSNLTALPPAGWEELKAIMTADSFSTARMEELLLDKWTPARFQVSPVDAPLMLDLLPDNLYTATGFKMLIKP